MNTSETTTGNPYKVSARRLLEVAAINRSLDAVLKGSTNHRATLATIFAHTGYTYGGAGQFMHVTGPNWQLDVLLADDDSVRECAFGRPDQPSIIA